MLECRHGYSSSENVFAISGNFGFGVGPEQQQDFPSANAERLARGRRVRGAGKELVINYLTICVRRVASCPSVQSHRFARRSRFCSSDQCPILARSPVAHGRGLEHELDPDREPVAEVARRARAWIGTLTPTRKHPGGLSPVAHGRGLEHARVADDMTGGRRRPSRTGVDWNILARLTGAEPKVARRARAWIGTGDAVVLDGTNDVARRARAWIGTGCWR